MRLSAMYPLDIIQEQEKRIQSLEKELTELRQGLAAVHDYFLQIRAQADEQSISAEINLGIVRPLKEDDAEFEGIWDFHEKMLVSDPKGTVPLDIMYDTYAQFCRKSNKKPVDKDAFEYLLPQMENPRPVVFRGKWQGCRFR
ncbi:hypothetical protein Mboo_2247 [Methanoregula boonei 6A8]|uniref:DNA primase/nucleoside triphosphatase C-terminal domain-containing protein n=1 Tax=Methanoregula boonei (strain DSM 21154 / JCM 14090 / 6A8) TaxID=456442 RepID=A7IAK0_METB6|nr:primase-like DNA-binding domain-containing protein [Methanoregula boonei]ABS56761.1 hypothetical protein Mboo_2247 [Methanoregula boonei 6A8]